MKIDWRKKYKELEKENQELNRKYEELEKRFVVLWKPKPKLTVELVPGRSWGVNARTSVPRRTWETIRSQVIAKVGARCEICGGEGKNHRVEFHEVWDYDMITGVQKLVKLIVLCPACHDVKHIGRASIQGRGQQAMEHFCQVNGWTKDEAEWYMSEVWRLWDKRCERKWKLDLSLLESLKDGKEL